MSATTDQGTERDGHVFSVQSYMSINPETIDAAVVEQSLVRDGTRSIVSIRWRGFDMQSYGCDPLDVAAAFARLANRIADAALDSRGDAAMSGEFVLPEGMTAEKLRSIANWLDLYDKMAEQVIVTYTQPDGTRDEVAGEAIATVRGKEVQVDLRRWADAIAAHSARSEQAVQP